MSLFRPQIARRLGVASASPARKIVTPTQVRRYADDSAQEPPPKSSAEDSPAAKGGDSSMIRQQSSAAAQVSHAPDFHAPIDHATSYGPPGLSQQS